MDECSVAGQLGLTIVFTRCGAKPRRLNHSSVLLHGVKTLWTQDTSDPRHFGTLRHQCQTVFGHFGTKEDTSALRYTGWQGGRMPS